MNRACQNCQWWTRHEPGEPYGTCRGAPPTHGAPWPSTLSDDWCGQFRMAERLSGVTAEIGEPE